MHKSLLGGLSPERFFREYWQKKPLLVRNAIPGFNGLLDPAELCDLAARDEVESRLVRQQRKQWQLTHGPFQSGDMPRRGAWTLLVQGVNLALPSADALLQQFDFVPYTRLDDLMVSYATDGGGVGPHFDSYDVFLLQGMGQRYWQISAQRDLSVIEEAPLRILRNFKPSAEWVLNPGDMLYLPPRYAHNGIAIGECMTYSIGFRAPSHQELVTEFLAFLQERLSFRGLYADPDLRPSPRPGRIPPDMVDKVQTLLNTIHWRKQDVQDFLGQYLSEPKPHVFFDRPARRLNRPRFLIAAQTHGVRLDGRTRMLYSTSKIHVNGESLASVNPALRTLADRRELDSLEGVSADAQDVLYEWYCCGFLGIRGTPD